MISGLHAMFYSSDAEATRTFLRDVLELGGHPVGAHEDGHCAGAHELSFMTADGEAAVARLTDKGVDCDPIQDLGWGLVTRFDIPGGIRVQLYQARYSK